MSTSTAKIPKSAARTRDWSILVVFCVMVGSILLVAGTFRAQNTQVLRALDAAPGLVTVEAEVLHRFRDRYDDLGPLELWRYTTGGQTWYRFETDRRLISDAPVFTLRVDPEKPWRALVDGQRVPGPLPVLQWLGGAALLVGLAAVVPLIRARRRVFTHRLSPEGERLAARFIALHTAPQGEDLFVLELASLDGTIRALSEPLPVDPRPYLPEQPIIVRQVGTPDHVVDLSFLPRVRYA